MSSTPTSPTSPTSPTDFIFRVILSYSPQVDGQIPLTTGDVVTDVKDLGNGWTLGRNVSRDCVGIFPSKCIRPMSDISPTTLPEQEAAPAVIATPRTLRSKANVKNNKLEQDQKAGKSGSLPAAAKSQVHVKPGGRVHTVNECPRHTPRKVRLVEERHPSFEESDPHDPHHPYMEVFTPGQSTDQTSSDSQSLEGSPKHSSGESMSDQDLTPSDVEYNSLPTPKRGKFVPAKKPHMVVKPNQGKNGNKPEARMEPVIREAQDQEEETGEVQANGQVIRHNGTESYGPAIAAGKVRMANPPAQLPLGMPGPHKRSIRNAGDVEKAAEHDCRGKDGRQRMTLLDVGPTQDRSTSPITGPAIPAECATLRHQTSEYDFERDNMANETLQQSPKMNHHEKYASINKPYYRDYRTLECPADGNYSTQLRYKPILKNRHQKVADSKGQHIYYREEPNKSTACTLILSVLAGLFFSSVMFLWMYYYLAYSFLVAIVLCSVLAIVLIVFFALSRMCRCMAVILIPSLCTTRGRIAFLILVTGILLGGPVNNVYMNMSEVSRSMSCSAEQTYNQTMLLLKPFDAMMIKLNETVRKLQDSAHDVHRGLRPLEEGLNKVELDIDNGHIQLMGTRKTCMTLVNKAFNSCAEGLTGAQDQCLGVMGALGTVYHHAREVLDRINPEHWAPKHHLLLKKRQVVLEGSNPNIDIQLPNTEGDICEKLDMNTVCTKLNNSEMLCQPAQWAGEAIQEAIDETSIAMASLEDALQFRVSSEPYNSTRINASKIIYEVQINVQREFADKTANFQTIIAIVLRVMPVCVLLLVYVAYSHVKCYLCSDTYDNTYITEHFKELDMKRSEVAGDNLLPLKRYEHNYLVDTTSSELSPPENGLYRIGLCVLVLHFVISFVCYMFDYILYWILALINKYANPTFDTTGRDSLELVVTGEGVIVELLDIFLQGFHPGQWFGYSANTQKCLAKPHQPSLVYLLVICLMYFLLFVIILLKGYILRFRNLITGYFYPERRKARIVHLYNVILNQRARMPKLLHQRARLNYRERQVTEKVSFCHQVGARCPPCRVFLYKSARCLVCHATEDQAFRDCETDKCYGVYCADCYDDLGRICPLCLHGMEYSDEEEYEELEDDLQPYHRSSKIYL